MLHQSYNLSLPKERLETYKNHFAHLTLVKPPKPEPSEAGAGVFITKKVQKPTVLASSYTLTEQKQKEADDFIEQALHEYITWLAQTELRLSKLRLSPIVESFKPTDFTPLQDKEATTDI